jgi:Ser/Thr protein kinase RdoA (MazF antagonist)
LTPANIGADVARAAESVLGASAACVERFTQGNINRVFKVVSGGEAFVLKVFRFPDWPEPGKLEWVESQLAARGVARARLIHHTRGAEFFPHGFTLSEYLPGDNCKQAVRDGRLNPSEYIELAGAYLRAAHAVEPPRFGYLGDGRGTLDDYVEWVVGSELPDRARDLADAPGLGASVCARAAERVERVLRSLGGRFRPALVHGDATPKNAVLVPEGRVVLVDWDEAFAAPWVWDYTHLSYWHVRYHGRDPSAVRAAFFRGHGPPEFDDEELDALERALHIVEALGVLAFQFRHGDAEEFARARDILTCLLDSRYTLGS